MFRRKSEDPMNPEQDQSSKALSTEQKRKRLLKIMIIVNVFIVSGIVVFSASGFVIHQSNTNPEFCGSCHIMESHVDSYLNSDNHLDNAHAEAGVLCKDCHDYPLDEEIKAGILFITNDYEVDETGELYQRDFGDEICTQCHISLEHVAEKTDFLYYNPHGTRMGTFTCNTCHISHGEQIDYCSECHTNGGQRMLGDTTPREELLGEPEEELSPYAGMYGG